MLRIIQGIKKSKIYLKRRGTRNDSLFFLIMLIIINSCNVPSFIGIHFETHPYPELSSTSESSVIFYHWHDNHNQKLRTSVSVQRCVKINVNHSGCWTFAETFPTLSRRNILNPVYEPHVHTKCLRLGM